jgi:prepilin-type N-terminal cleavage/methylation domain-containing protein
MQQPVNFPRRAVLTLSAIPRPGRNSQFGFTLVEMLVVLLIVGMVSGLLFEGAAQLMSMQARLERQLTRLRGEALRADWWRQVVQGLQPDYADGKQMFKGSPRGFSGLSTNPLTAGYGALQPFAVTLTHDAASDSMLLGYDGGSKASVLLSWPGDRGSLRYLDDRGEVHESWPPPLGRWPQLPKAITLDGERDGTPWLIAAAPFGPTWPIPRPRDIVGAVR